MSYSVIVGIRLFRSSRRRCRFEIFSRNLRQNLPETRTDFEYVTKQIEMHRHRAICLWKGEEITENNSSLIHDESTLCTVALRCSVVEISASLNRSFNFLLLSWRSRFYSKFCKHPCENDIWSDAWESGNQFYSRQNWIDISLARKSFSDKGKREWERENEVSFLQEF